MNLVRPDELQSRSDGTTCRQSSLVKLILLGIFSAIPGGLVAAWWSGHLPTLLFVPIGGFTALIALMIFSDWRATLQPTNWVLRIGPRNLLLNLRSYANRRFEEALTVVRIEYNELQSVRKHIAKHAAPGGKHEEHWTEKSLDLVFADPVPDEIVEALRAENQRKNPERRTLGITVRGGEQRSPVTVPETNVMRIAWTGKYAWVTPRLGKVLSILEQHVRITESHGDDRSDWRNMDDATFDNLILSMVERGDRLTAIKLLQERRGYTLTKAKQFVDELTACV